MFRLLWSAGWIEWRTAEALDQILNWRSCTRRGLCTGSGCANSDGSRRIADTEDSPRSRRRVRRQISRVEIIAGAVECASGFRDHEIEVIARAVIITRTHPLRKIIRRDDSRILLVGISLPAMTVDREHLRVAGAEWVRHSEAHLIAWVRSEDRRLRFSDLRWRIHGRIRQRVGRHARNVCSRFSKTVVGWFSAVVDRIDWASG